MLMKSLQSLALLLLAAPGLALAAPDLPAVVNVHAPITVALPEIPEGGWFTSAELGAIATSGNTTGTSITGKIDARHETANWSHEFIVSGFFKEDEYEDDDGNIERSKSAERFSVSAKASLKLLGDGKRAFILGSHVNDRFGAYTRYSSVAVGHGSNWFTTPDQSLDVEIGPGYFAGERPNGEEESGLTVRGAARFRWRVSPSAYFAQSVSVEKGTSNTYSVAETSLSTKINSTMQMKAGFSARNNTSVPLGKRNTDTQTSLTMVYSF
jgi:putative salt-induced outer membrane protein